MENQVVCTSSRARRRRRKRDSVELSLFSYVKSQCSQHELSDFCTYRNCHFQNLESLEKLLMSARKSIQVAMYQFSVRSINDAIKFAKDKNNVDVQIIVDSKMRLNQGSIFQEMIAYDYSVKWPKTASSAMACLMHHKFILIDAVAKEPRSSADGGGDSDSSSDEEEEVNLCSQCMASDENVKSENVSKCLQCRPVRIRSKEDLIKFPSPTLPRLPKHGLLITGSHNWSQQAFRENYENILITSNPQHITDYSNEFKYLWTKGLKETYTFGEQREGSFFVFF